MHVRSPTALRFAYLTLLGALLALTTGSHRAPAVVAQETRPNIVVIETDDQTAASLRFMPNVNQLLVKQGVLFENNFASYPLCCPSRATFLTGQYAHNHGVRGNKPPLGGYVALDHTNTLPIWLQQAGYHTSFVGKYLNGYGEGIEGEINPEEPPGWSDWNAVVRTPGKATISYVGFTLNENGTLVEYPPNQANYLTDVFTRKAIEAINRGASSGSPFFLWLAHFAPHGGLPVDPDDNRGVKGVNLNPSPAARHKDMFSSERVPPSPAFNEADVSDKPHLISKLPRLTEAQMDAIHETYQQRLEALQAVDEGVAQIVQALRNARQLANTLIVFTSDNGLMHGEHRIMPDAGKGYAYEPSTRVPLVMRGLDLPRGHHVADLVSNVDLAPTILALTKATPGRVQDGRSLLPLARDRLANFGRDLLLESSRFTAIRTDRYVLISHYRRSAWELYDLKTDRYELRSLHRDPKVRSLRAELARRLLDLGTCFGAFCLEDPHVRLRLTARSGGSVQADVVGGDADWIATTRFYVGGKRVAADNLTPFGATLPSTLFTSEVATVRARVNTKDGRSVTLTTRVALQP